MRCFMDSEKTIRNEESIKQINKKIDLYENKFLKLDETYLLITKLNCRIDNLESLIEKVNNKLEQNITIKGKKWDKLIDYLFYAIVAYALFKLGLKG